MRTLFEGMHADQNIRLRNYIITLLHVSEVCDVFRKICWTCNDGKHSRKKSIKAQVIDS